MEINESISMLDWQQMKQKSIGVNDTSNKNETVENKVSLIEIFIYFHFITKILPF